MPITIPFLTRRRSARWQEHGLAATPRMGDPEHVQERAWCSRQGLQLLPAAPATLGTLADGGFARRPMFERCYIHAEPSEDDIELSRQWFSPAYDLRFDYFAAVMLCRRLIQQVIGQRPAEFDCCTQVELWPVQFDCHNPFALAMLFRQAGCTKERRLTRYEQRYSPPHEGYAYNLEWETVGGVHSSRTERSMGAWSNLQALSCE